MEAPFIRTIIVAIFFLLATILFTIILIHTYVTPPGQSALISSLTVSAWSKAFTIDYVAGVSFNFLYLWLLNGPPLLYIPSRIWSLLILYSNIFPLSYVTYLLLSRIDSSNRLTDASLLQRSSRTQLQRHSNIKKTVSVMVLFTTILCFCIGSRIYALYTESIPSGFSSIVNYPWNLCVVLDDLLGLMLTLAFVMEKEQTLMWSQLMWFVAFCMLGNIASCLYVLTLSVMALSKGIGFGSCLLTKRILLTNIDQVEASSLLPTYENDGGENDSDNFS